MSEFSCRCGEFMVYNYEKKKRICQDCGSDKVYTMDGATNSELRKEDREE